MSEALKVYYLILIRNVTRILSLLHQPVRANTERRGTCLGEVSKRGFCSCS